MQEMADPLFQHWFHGRISRIEAEELLARNGKSNGLFLLRESTASAGSYALSMCHNGKIIHYHIQRHADGMVAIEDGKKFPGPVELVYHHQHALDGLLTKLADPCNRLPGVPPRTFSGTNQEHIKDAAVAAMTSMGLQDGDESTATLMRAKLESAIGSVLHKNQVWFHTGISREEAERRLNVLGCQNGMFLIREKDPGFVLGLCHEGSVVHYLFDVDHNQRLSIKSGPKFDNLMLAVDHYTQREDGLLCKLRDPCNVELFEGKLRRTSVGTRPRSVVDQDLRTAATNRPPSRSFNETNPFASNPFLQGAATASVPDILHGVPSSPPRNPPPPIPGFSSTASNRMSGPPRLPPRPIPHSPVSPGRGPPPLPSPTPATAGATGGHSATGASASRGATFESIYDSVKMKKSSFYFNQFKDVQTRKLRSENLKLEQELGHGNFGSVLKGEYTKGNGEKIPVAVKKLKSEEMNNPKSEIFHEAEVMMKLDHPNIVRIIGICQDPVVMLVMELAPEGPLHKYLKKHKSLPMFKIFIIMLQVAEGMQYLENMQFVHRDLAARNILVVNEDFVKISDFGMSRAMGAGSDYYKAGKAGKWPLKWYAPECIYYRKFSSKSDVWSYGVTLWEATSYGKKPYEGLNGQLILEKIEENYRLECPPNVPSVIYKVMRSCWQYR
ncbi:tyrosine-protein kinase SYK-like isoform X1 [Orbicella faveolata]|uniref:tyrosine-protein kinase SYK-like isoform X1 n=1 Tax=Orbicella faveolata TaxID=48498 RepID=UPI0009E3DBF1|nr:tyrosine-protein kinase SYK-like isoform X1 [Orbicella faveolata]